MSVVRNPKAKKTVRATTRAPETVGPRQHGSTIRAVELETGIGPLVLRAWERRFGFPAPERRPGSDRRLYSAADVERLTWIKRALGRGYRIGDVIHKPVTELATALGEGPPEKRESREPDLASVRSMIDLLRSEQMDEFDRCLRRKRATSDVRSFLVDFAHPLMVEVGRAWEDGRLSVRHEHLATDSMTTILRQMFGEVQPTGTSPTVVLGALPGEVYSLPLLFVALYLAASGARVRLLGNETPEEEFAETARALRADVVGVSVSVEFDPALAARSLTRLRSAVPANVSLWVGGTGARASAPKRTEIVDSWSAIDETLERVRSPLVPARRGA